MKNLRNSSTGFSLIELLTVVLIIGILAAIAIPSYTKYIRKSRISEAMTNLAAIDTFEESYFSENDQYLCLQKNPAEVPRRGLKKDSNNVATLFNGTFSDWAAIGRVVANGTPLNFQYQVWAGSFNSAGTYVASTCLAGYATTVTPGSGTAFTCAADTSRNISASSLGIPNTASSNFFFATASSDQNGDSAGKCSLFIKVIDRPEIRSYQDIE